MNALEHIKMTHLVKCDQQRLEHANKLLQKLQVVLGDAVDEVKLYSGSRHGLPYEVLYAKGYKPFEVHLINNTLVFASIDPLEWHTEEIGEALRRSEHGWFEKFLSKVFG